MALILLKKKQYFYYSLKMNKIDAFISYFKTVIHPGLVVVYKNALIPREGWTKKELKRLVAKWRCYIEIIREPSKIK